jgi:large subunit ribosomal protein L18
MFTSKELFERRRQRTRSKLRQTCKGQLRLSVHRSSKHIYAQVIDDTAGITLAAASTLDADFKSASNKTADVAAASVVGKLVAERAKAKGIDAVVFDRGGYIFHGRVKALAEAARDAGLKF